MTSLLDARTEAAEPVEVPELDALTGDLGEGGPDEPPSDVVAPAALGLAVVSGALSAAGAAWMIGGTFRGGEARLVGLLGVLLGSALVYFGTRWRSPALQYLVLPA